MNESIVWKLDLKDVRLLCKTLYNLVQHDRKPEPEELEALKRIHKQVMWLISEAEHPTSPLLKIIARVFEWLTPPETATKPVRFLYRAMTMIFVGVLSLLILAGASLLLGIVTGGNN